MQPLVVSKRYPKRSRVFLTAQLASDNGPINARVRDISRSGALLESDTEQQVGASVRLICGGAHVDARVAWVDGGCLGLEFETPLLVASLIDQSGSRLHVSAPRSYRRSDFD